MRAMRYLQAVVHNRPNLGRDITTHMRATSVDQNDPAAVRESIIIFLEDTASVARLCVPSHATVAPVASAHAPALVGSTASVRALTEKVDKLQAALSSLMTASASTTDANALSLVSQVLTELGGTP